jgi:hypothetical protein
MPHHSGRGGIREGAGAPQVQRTKRHGQSDQTKQNYLKTRLTPTEKALVQEYVRRLREKEEKHGKQST